MASFVDSPAPHERDFRSASHEWKRGKTSAEKWSRGTMPSPGVRLDMWTGEPNTGSESQRAKVRPHPRQCDIGHHSKRSSANIVKMRRNWDNNSTLFRTRLHAKCEINDANRYLGDLPTSTPALVRRQSVGDNVLYSFDSLDTPGRPYTLDFFVKAPTARETEKFVEKEYEILDTHGQALKGRKARRELRQAHADPGAQETIVEDEGFELV
ncbi:hypothetical protein QBC39DRAFT_13602 [Podospora conica]|nr:hypothetical protein QBC39DRAFT_13602 [Schizothecium conicum]